MSNFVHYFTIHTGLTDPLGGGRVNDGVPAVMEDLPASVSVYDNT